jgi:hypothetical protein
MRSGAPAGVHVPIIGNFKLTFIADDLPQLPCVVHDRIHFKEITRNHAAESVGNVVMDFRPRIPPPRMGMAN